MEENNLILDLTTAVYRVMDKMQAAPSIDAIVKRLQQINLRSGLYLTDRKGVSPLGVVEPWVTVENIVGALHDVELKDGRVLARFVPMENSKSPTEKFFAEWGRLFNEEPARLAVNMDHLHAMFFGRNGKVDSEDMRVAYFYYSPI